MPETVTLRTDHRGVATVTLKRPDKHNALSSQMITELTEIARAITADTSIRVVVLTGAGASFCAGGDLGWMKAQFTATRPERMEQARQLAQMLYLLNSLPKPLIGRINGAAYGGGVGLACVCDVAIAADTATFGLTETRLGLIPATISPYVLARMGEGHARRVFMSARRIQAQEAVDLNLIARAVPAADLDKIIEAEIEPYLSTAPGAVAAAKALARDLGSRIDAEIIEDTVRRLADTWETTEAQEGIAAFFARRPPPWAVSK